MKHEMQREPVAVTQMLRQALDCDRLRRVLRMAGADEVVGDAPQALRETAADAVARRIARTAAGLPIGREPAAMDPNTYEEARAATKRAYLEVAVLMAGGGSSEAVQQALAHEIVLLAEHAVRFARAEGRAVDHHCIAVAAARSAGDPAVSFVPGV